MRFLERASNFILNAVLCGLVGIGLLVVGSLLPIFGVHRVFVVLSGSMEPAIQTGSVIFVNPVSAYHIGNIVTWRPSNGGTPITHRIVREIPGGKVETRGDANTAEDEPIET